MYGSWFCVCIYFGSNFFTRSHILQRTSWQAVPSNVLTIQSNEKSLISTFDINMPQSGVVDEIPLTNLIAYPSRSERSFFPPARRMLSSSMFRNSPLHLPKRAQCYVWVEWLYGVSSTVTDPRQRPLTCSNIIPPEVGKATFRPHCGWFLLYCYQSGSLSRFGNNFRIRKQFPDREMFSWLHFHEFKIGVLKERPTRVYFSTPWGVKLDTKHYRPEASTYRPY